MQLPAQREADLVATVRRNPDSCLVFPPDTYTRPDGALTVHRGGGQQLLHRRLFTLIIGDLGRVRLERHCATFGCCNPYHFRTIGRLPSAKCPHGHRLPAGRAGASGTCRACTPQDDTEARVRRRRGAAAVNATKLYCPALHEYTPDNTYVYVDKRGVTRRKCRACNREARAQKTPLAR